MAATPRQPLFSAPRPFTVRRDELIQNLQQTTLAVVVPLIITLLHFDAGRPNSLVSKHEDPVQNLQQTTLRVVTPLVLPLFHFDAGLPNRLPSKHDDQVQNLQQSTLKVAATVLPFVNVDAGRPQGQASKRDDSIGTNYQLFLVPPATTPAINVWFSRPVRIELNKHEAQQRNLQLFLPAAATAAPFVNADFSWPQALSHRNDDFRQLFIGSSLPFSGTDFGRPQALVRTQDKLTGLSFQIAFPPAATTPFVLPDLSARPQSIYKRVDGPLGSPLMLMFPLSPSVLPYNTYWTHGRGINPLIRVWEGQGVNLQLFPPITPTSTIPHYVGFLVNIGQMMGRR